MSCIFLEREIHLLLIPKIILIYIYFFFSNPYHLQRNKNQEKKTNYETKQFFCRNVKLLVRTL